MLRSFDYAARYVLTERSTAELASLEPPRRGLGGPQPPGLPRGLPRDARDRRPAAGRRRRRRRVLLAYELDKALYELDYEQAHRPDWASPAQRIRRLLQGRRPARCVAETGRRRRGEAHASPDARVARRPSPDLAAGRRPPRRSAPGARPPRRGRPGLPPRCRRHAGDTGLRRAAGCRADDPGPPGRHLRGRRCPPGRDALPAGSGLRAGRTDRRPIVYDDPYRVVADDRRPRPAPLRGGPAPPAVGDARRPSPGPRGHGRACPSPCGRPTPGPCGWSATGTTGTAGSTPCARSGSSGVWELFIPGVAAGARYKFELVTADGRLILKTDPDGLRHRGAAGAPPAWSSPTRRRTCGPTQAWMADRAQPDLLRRADDGLRGAPRLLAPRPRRRRPAGAL